MKKRNFILVLSLVIFTGISEINAQSNNYFAPLPPANLTGDFNTGVGHQSMFLTTSGTRNSALGMFSLWWNSVGSENVAFGRQALFANTIGNFNVAVGSYAGMHNTTGNFNTFVGPNCGINGAGDSNTFIGNVRTPSNVFNSIILATGGDNANPGVQRLFINPDGRAGIDVGNNPNLINRLEINAANAFNNSTGLRFRGLTPAALGSTETATKFLTIDTNGDVVLRQSPQAQPISSVINTISNGQLVTTVNNVASSPVVLPAAAEPRTFYNGDGSLTNTVEDPDNQGTGLRTVTMKDNNIFFQTSRRDPTKPFGGKIYIGAASNFNFNETTGNYRLYVEEGILTERVKVALRWDPTADPFSVQGPHWADYVFANDYKLMPLKEIESFVKENKHLPGIESACELLENGLDLGDMQAKQMGKIEELTLYAIEQEKRLDKQSKEIEELKVLVKALLEKK